MKLQVRVTDSNALFRFMSEPFVIYTRRGYAAAIDVMNVHTGEEGYLLLSAQSLADQLHEIVASKAGKFEGTAVLIKKASKDRMSPYVVTDPSM
jgi:hypothetical protein